MKYLLTLALLLVATFARADVAYQSTATPDTGGAITSLSTTINPSGSNLAVIIGVYGSAQAAPPTVTYGAQTPVLIEDGGTDIFEPSLWLYYVIPSAPGTQTISVTFGVNCPRCALGAIAFTGVHQTVPVGTADSVATAVTNTHTATVTDSVATGMIVDWIMVSGTSVLADGSQTMRWEAEDWDSVFNSVGMSTKTGIGSVAMTWTTPDDQDGGHIAVSLLPAEGGGGSVVPSIYQVLRQQKR
jgi:hypothetical protein